MNVAVVNGQVVADTLVDDVSERIAALNALAVALAAPPLPRPRRAASASRLPRARSPPRGAAGLAVGAPGVVFTTPATTPGLFGTTAIAPAGVLGGATTGKTGF